MCAVRAGEQIDASVVLKILDAEENEP